jgi:hypothetical protein
MWCSPFDPEFALQCHAEPIKGANRLMKSLKSEPNMGKVHLSHQARTRNEFKWRGIPARNGQALTIIGGNEL